MPAPRLRPPSPPARPRLRGTLRLQRPRTLQSVELDDRQAKDGSPMPEFVPWDRFIREFRWKQGEHLTTIGPTGSGKTVLNRQLLKLRDYVVVLGTKKKDPELYGPFEKEGYELTRTFNPSWIFDDDEPNLVLFIPTTSKSAPAERRAELKRKFGNALAEIYDESAPWCVYCDDVAYLADQLGLDAHLEELWMNARSAGITVVASAQEPVNIPVTAYGSATHLFLFSNPDFYRVKRMAELAGQNRDMVQQVILALPHHEFLYINKVTRQMVRSKVTAGVK